MGGSTTRVARNARRQEGKRSAVTISESFGSETAKYDRQDGVTKSDDGRQDGVVKWFHDVKGYGFITVEGMDKDAFVHHMSIEMDGFRTLKAGQKVSLILVPMPKGPEAKEVRPLS